MPSIFTRACFFFSSFGPIFGVLYLLTFSDVIFKDKVKIPYIAQPTPPNNFELVDPSTPILAESLWVLICVSVFATVFTLAYLLLLPKLQSPEAPTRVCEVRNRNDQMLGHLFGYLIIFAIEPFDGPRKMMAMGFFFLVFFAMALRAPQLFNNPWLMLFGWDNYDVKSNTGDAMFVISRERPKVGHNISLIEVGDFMYVHLPTNPDEVERPLTTLR